MKNKFFLLTLILVCFGLGQSKAQIYASVTDPATGELIYYNIYSAKPEYSGKCMTDNSTAATSLKILISDSVAGNQYQQWEMKAVAADTATYYLRNRKSHNYMQNSAVSSGDYDIVQVIGLRSKTKPYTVTFIGNGQVLISYADNNAINHYLCAADMDDDPENLYLDDVQDSRYAWYIQRVNATPTGVKNLALKDPVTVNVLNGHIVIGGTRNFSVYDMSGRLQPQYGMRMPGIYIVRTPAKSFKVLVK